MNIGDIFNKKGYSRKELSESDEWKTDMINGQIEALDDASLISDGAHTFDELYYHRMILFATICNQNEHEAWKSKLHHDGTKYEDSFLVGIDTPEGQFTYHYPLEYWKYFKVKKYALAPEFDGHTSQDVSRLLSLIK